MSPVPKSTAADAAKEPVGTDANTTPPSETPTDAEPGQADTRGAERARPASSGPGQPNFSGPSSGDEAQRQARQQKETFDAQNAAAKRKTVYEATHQAHENLIREVEGMQSQLGQGYPITATQLETLKNSMKGVGSTFQSLNAGTVEGHQPSDAPPAAAPQR